MLLFLDIDGVMVPAKGWKSPELLKDGFPAFSEKAKRALQRLLSGEVTLILTTSHKSRFSMEEWRTIFHTRGLYIENIKALPENINNVSRREEILCWFKENEITQDFIILDDDKSLNDLPGSLKKNLLQTSPDIGLTEQHVRQFSDHFFDWQSKQGR